jgi:N-acyl-D-aspartate/D-glutamate deacylase
MSEPPPSFSRARRRLLVAGGFGALSYAVLRELPDQTGGRAQGSTSPTPTTTTIAVREPVAPPAVADAAPAPDPDHVYDLVIEGGRVIDPDTGFDRVAHVGVDGDTITAIDVDTDRALEARTRIDAQGLVVAPGFIDILSYEPNEYGIWYKIADGVTTNLGMHGINNTADAFFAQYTGRVPCHFGGAFDDPYMRNQLLGLNVSDEALPSQVDQLEEQLRLGIGQGWIGLDLEPEYTPGVQGAEISDLARIAADLGIPVFFHARYSEPERNLEGIDEILAVARDTGAAVHVDHITSTGGTYTMPETLARLDAARAEGIDVTACLYPYDFWATTLGSARFGPDPTTGEPAVDRFRIEYEDLVIVGTDEHLNQTAFDQMRANGENPLVAALGSIPEEEIEAALQTDWIMMGSDAILEPGDNNHPRSTGCFSRLLGRYVRERRVLSLQDALAKATILPATRLERGAPVMAKKGRLQRGAHADITVFDPATILDRGTVESPATESVGVQYVVVSGEIVRDPDGNRTDVLPGQPITSA